MENNQQKQHRVVVTGLGAVSALGLNVQDTWEALVKGESGVDFISSFDTADYDVKFAAEVKGFDVSTYVNRKEARRMDRFTQFAVAASYQAVQSAGLAITEENAEDIGVIIGNSVCGLLSVCEQIKVLEEDGPSRVSPILAPTMIGDAPSVQVSLLLGVKGINYATSSACASGADAISQAYDLIRQGYARAMIAGGTEASVIPIVLAAFSNIRHYQPKTQTRDACRPSTWSGTVLYWEGAAIMVLEEAEPARERGAIIAEAVGCGA